ncbi:MAG: terminase gpP N-terminus-related DNA-binding protein [Culicoidibacterales bacterium]
MNKKDAAKTLFMQGWSQTNIASILSVQESTIGAWVKKEAWKATKQKVQAMMISREENIREIFDYQVGCLMHIKHQRVEAGNMVPFDKGDLDALQKTWTMLKGKETKWSDEVALIKLLAEYLHDEDLETAKVVLPLLDKFINERRKAYE